MRIQFTFLLALALLFTVECIKIKSKIPSRGRSRSPVRSPSRPRTRSRSKSPSKSPPRSRSRSPRRSAPRTKVSHKKARAKQYNGVKLTQLPNEILGDIHSRLSIQDQQNLNLVSKDSREALIQTGKNRPVPRHSDKQRQIELHQLRKNMKGKGLKDSTRHARHHLRAKPGEPGSDPQMRHESAERANYEQDIYAGARNTLSNMAKNHPGEKITAAVNTDEGRFVSTMQSDHTGRVVDLPDPE